VTDPRVTSLLDEFSIRLVPKNVYPKLGETRAVGNIGKMIDRHGMDVARIVMRSLVETTNNKASLESDAIGATLDLLLARREDYEADPSKWFAVFDACPVGDLQVVARDLRGVVPLRHALAGLIYERVWRAFGPRSTQPDFFDDRMVSR
jgi:hypothetical protein